MINFCFSALPAVFLHVFYMQILILPRLCLICEGPCEREHMWLRLFIMLKCENYAVPCAHFYLLSTILRAVLVDYSCFFLHYIVLPEQTLCLSQF